MACRRGTQERRPAPTTAPQERWPAPQMLAAGKLLRLALAGGLRRTTHPSHPGGLRRTTSPAPTATQPPGQQPGRGWAAAWEMGRAGPAPPEGLLQAPAADDAGRQGRQSRQGRQEARGGHGPGSKHLEALAGSGWLACCCWLALAGWLGCCCQPTRGPSWPPLPGWLWLASWQLAAASSWPPLPGAGPPPHGTASCANTVPHRLGHGPARRRLLPRGAEQHPLVPDCTEAVRHHGRCGLD